MIALLRSVLRNEVPPAKPELVSLEEVYRLARYHSVEAMAYEGVRQRKEKRQNRSLCG